MDNPTPQEFLISHRWGAVPLTLTATGDKVPLKGYKWKAPALLMMEDDLRRPPLSAWQMFGIPTERNGLIVIDCDINKQTGEPVGLNNFLAICPGNEPPHTLTIKTPSGGRHFYFTTTEPAKFKTCASEFLPNVDVRAKGGMIVSPYSRNHKGIYAAECCNAEIMELPEWLAVKLPPASKPRPVIERREPVHYACDSRAVKYIKTLLEVVRSCGSGTRNNTLNKLAWTAYNMTPHYFSAEQITEWFTAAALEAGLDRASIAATLKSAEEAPRKVFEFR